MHSHSPAAVAGDNPGLQVLAFGAGDLVGGLFIVTVLTTTNVDTYDGRRATATPTRTGCVRMAVPRSTVTNRAHATMSNARAA